MAHARKHKHFFGWRPDKPDYRDKSLTINYFKRFGFMLPASVDLRPDMPAVYDQGELGSCTGNAIAGALAYAHKRQKLPTLNPSRLFIYYCERELEGTVAFDAGAEIRDGIKAIARWGVCEESVWPYEAKAFADKPNHTAYHQARRDIIKKYSRVAGQSPDYLKATLARGMPIVFGFSVYENFDSVGKSGNVPMPKGSQAGGHAVLLVGYSDQGFIVRNSWGAGWGDKGYCYFPADYLANTDLATDFWCIDVVR